MYCVADRGRQRLITAVLYESITGHTYVLEGNVCKLACFTVILLNDKLLMKFEMNRK